MGRLAGKVAIVTGGARGMGAATCRLFVEEGARVVIGDVLDAEGEALARELGDAARFVRLDVADEASWARVAEAAVEQFGRIDVLVNNAAVLTFGGITELSKRDFERAVSINLVGTFVGIRTIAPRMIAQQSGSIVNISSVDGLRGVNALAAYVSSKWGGAWVDEGRRARARSPGRAREFRPSGRREHRDVEPDRRAARGNQPALCERAAAARRFARRDRTRDAVPRERRSVVLQRCGTVRRRRDGGGRVLPRIAWRTVLSGDVWRAFKQDVCVRNLIQGLPE